MQSRSYLGRYIQFMGHPFLAYLDDCQTDVQTAIRNNLEEELI
jgi:hypothetical protein